MEQVDKPHLIDDEQCLNGKWVTLCGVVLADVSIRANFMSVSKHYAEEELCPDCVNAPEYPLLVLLYLDGKARSWPEAGRAWGYPVKL